MIASARLPQELQERLGTPAAGQLLDWMEKVEERSRIDMRAHADQLAARFDARLEAGLAGIRVEMERMRADLLKWMFLFWLGSLAANLAMRGL